MTVPVDFLRLYQELNLPSSASFDDVRLAYRRRVSELHPDRAEAMGAPRSAERLQQLTALYAATAAFYRRHGRLPGSAIPPPVTPPQAPPARQTPSASTPPPVGIRRRSRRVTYVLAALAVGCVVWLASAFWQEESEGDAVDSAESPVPTPIVHVPDAEPAPLAAIDPLRPQVLQLGMPAEDVALIEDVPISRTPEHWDYGPSWIEFREAKVVDWYSSPLRPLKMATRHPTDPPMH